MRKNTGIKMNRGDCDTDLNRKIIVPYVGNTVYTRGWSFYVEQLYIIITCLILVTITMLGPAINLENARGTHLF